jgi:hypothetical protein
MGYPKADEPYDATRSGGRFFWVIEWTEDHHYHAHVVFWLDGSKTQNTYPWAQQAGLYWRYH